VLSAPVLRDNELTAPPIGVTLPRHLSIYVRVMSGTGEHRM
jgi:hypothetical protein